MRAVAIAPFLLRTRISLERLLASGGTQAPKERFTRLITVLDERLPGDRPANPHLEEPTDLYFDDYGPRGAAEVDNQLYDRLLEHETLGSVRVFLSFLSIGFLCFTVDFEDHEELLEWEKEVGEQADALIRQISAIVAESVRPELVESDGWATYAPERVLWWHVVSLDRPMAIQPATVRLYGVSCLVEGGTCVVGAGYTGLFRDAHVPRDPGGAQAEAEPWPEDVVVSVVEGIVYATQQWLLVDEGNKVLGAHLATLGTVGQGEMEVVDEQFIEVVRLTRLLTMRDEQLKNHISHLEGIPNAACQAAITAWHIPRDMERFDARMNILRNLANMNRQRLQNTRDDSRNRLLFVFTAVTLLQSVLIWYDFITNSAIVTAHGPRPAIAYLVLLFSLIALVGALISQPSRLFARIRHALWRIPHRLRALLAAARRPEPSVPESASAPTVLVPVQAAAPELESEPIAAPEPEPAPEPESEPEPEPAPEPEPEAEESEPVEPEPVEPELS